MITSGLVLYGINNLFTVLIDGKQRDCKIKGKELKGVIDEYNALAAGDYVELDGDDQIIARLDRSNAIRRFNWKLKKPQTICANVDLGLCIVAAQNPPMHPRFLDRLLISCEKGGVKPLIIVNKCDKGLDEIEDHIRTYHELGYTIMLCSALSGEGLDAIKRATKGLKCAMIGSSGVGKSSLLNALSGIEYQKTAEINRKFDRGNHQTNFSIFIKRDEGGYWIDTPGVRDLTPPLDDAIDLLSFYHDFYDAAQHCAYSSCRHREEPECGVKEAIMAGSISESRYAGYIKLYEEITLKNESQSRYRKK